MNANSGKSDTGHDAKSGALIWKAADWMCMRVGRMVAAIVAIAYVRFGKINFLERVMHV